MSVNLWFNKLSMYSFQPLLREIEALGLAVNSSSLFNFVLHIHASIPPKQARSWIDKTMNKKKFEKW